MKATQAAPKQLQGRGQQRLEGQRSLAQQTSLCGPAAPSPPWLTPSLPFFQNVPPCSFYCLCFCFLWASQSSSVPPHASSATVEFWRGTSWRPRRQRMSR